MYVNDANDQPWDRFDKWSLDIDMSDFDTEVDWYKHIKNWYTCTKSVMLRSFIYNYNMRNMVTQKFLHTIGIKEQSVCPHCKICDQKPCICKKEEAQICEDCNNTPCAHQHSQAGCNISFSFHI